MIYKNSQFNLNKIYNVGLHKSGKYLYASTQITVEDLSTHTKVCRYFHWGSLDDDMRFYPNKTFRDAPEELKNLLYFPEDWDLSLISRGNPMTYTKKHPLHKYVWHQEETTPSQDLKRIFSLIRTLRENHVDPNVILDAVLSMEDPSES